MKNRNILILCFISAAFCGVFGFAQDSYAVDYLAEYCDTGNATSPAIPGTDPTATTTTSTVGFNIGTGALNVDGSEVSSGDGFIVRYTRDIGPGEYSFNIGSDDGSRIYVGDTQVIDMWVDQSYTTSTGAYINTSTQELKIEYYENA